MLIDIYLHACRDAGTHPANVPFVSVSTAVSMASHNHGIVRGGGGHRRQMQRTTRVPLDTDSATVTTESSDYGAVTLSRMNFCGYAGLLTMFSLFLATACCF